MSAQLPLVVLDAASLIVDGRSILQEIHLVVHAGEIWQIHGSAGSGKSVLLELLYGRHRLASGQRRYPAFIEDFPDAAIGIPPRFALRLVSGAEQRRIAVDQATFYQARWHAQWIEPVTIDELLSPANVMGLRAYEVLNDLPLRSDFEAARNHGLLELGLMEKRSQAVGQLSNGELRKLLLLVAHLAAPRLLLLDDPLGGLDPEARDVVSNAILRWSREGQTLVYCSTHDDDLAGTATHHLELERGSAKPYSPRKSDAQAPATAHLVTAPSPIDVLPPPDQVPMVRCRNLCVSAYGQVILDGIDWEIYPNEHWICTGPNGSGKSTLLALLMGDHPQAYCNAIEIFGKRLGHDTSLRERQRTLGYVAPELGWHYPAGWSVHEVVLSGFDSSIGQYQEPTRDECELAQHWLERLGLSKLAAQPLGAVSEGAARLALLARALVRRPPLLLLDEPTLGLAEADRRRFFAELDALVDAGQSNIVLVTHHFGERPRCINRHLALDKGRVAVKGAAAPVHSSRA